MFDVIIWYGIACLLGFLALPLCFTVFHRLPDRGYAFSKPLGLLLTGLLIWWVGNLKLAPLVQWSCWLMVIALAVIGNLLLFFNRPLSYDIRDWFSRKPNLKLVLTAELVFLAAFAFITNLRSFFPDLDQSEKFFNLAFINSIAASPTLPAPDPWFGGQPMNYYYGGHFLIGVLSKLSGTLPSTGYNIAMGLVYAMVTLACFGLASNLIGLARQKAQPEKDLPAGQPVPVFASIRYGLLGAALITVLGNLYPLRQLLEGGLLPFGDPNFPMKIGWPTSARMIYDQMPGGKMLDILTEYPIYSYLNGDLHAHLLGAPYLVLALGFGLNLFVAPAKWALARPGWLGWLRLIPGGIVLGAPYFINAGDFPTMLFLGVVALLVAESRAGGRWWRIAGRWGLQFAGMVAALWLVYVWYFTSFSGMLSGKALNDLPVIGFFSRYLGGINWERTNLIEFLVMFGLFLLPILTFYSLKIARLWQQEKLPSGEKLSFSVRTGVQLIGVSLVGLGGLGLWRIVVDISRDNLSLESMTLALASWPVAIVALSPGVWEAVRLRPRLALEAMIMLGLLAEGPLLRFELLGPLAFLLYFSLRLAWKEWRQDNWIARLDSFVMLGVALASALVLFAEVLYVRDIYENRFNTVFKFWYQSWHLLGFGGVYAIWRVVGRTAEVWVGEKSGVTKLPEKKPLLAAFRRTWLPRNTSLLLNFAQLRHQRPAEGPELEKDWGYGSGQSVRVPPIRPKVEAHSVAHPLVLAGWWRRGWITLLVLLMLAASAVPTLAYWQATHGYTNRVGLNGEGWYAAEFPAEYPAMTWLRNYTWNNPERRGVVLEVNGMNYSWADRVSTYTGLPTVVGWPFHELQWRGNLDQLSIWEDWLDMGRIYETTDSAQAIALLKKHNVRYVFVGQAENGTRSLTGDNKDLKRYSPEALAKFATFMKTIYADPVNNIYIYAFD